MCVCGGRCVCVFKHSSSMQYDYNSSRLPVHSLENITTSSEPMARSSSDIFYECYWELTAIVFSRQYMCIQANLNVFFSLDLNQLQQWNDQLRQPSHLTTHKNACIHHCVLNTYSIAVKFSGKYQSLYFGKQMPICLLINWEVEKEKKD